MKKVYWNPCMGKNFVFLWHNTDLKVKIISNSVYMEHGKDTSSLILWCRCTLKETWYLCLRGDAAVLVGCRMSLNSWRVFSLSWNGSIKQNKSRKFSIIVFSHRRTCYFNGKKIPALLRHGNRTFGFSKCFPVFLPLRLAACSQCRRKFRAFFRCNYEHTNPARENLKIQADRTNNMSKTTGDVNRCEYVNTYLRVMGCWSLYHGCNTWAGRHPCAHEPLNELYSGRVLSIEHLLNREDGEDEI